MLTSILKRFSSTSKSYGNLRDSDRIFTNVYKDSDPYIKGALRRVFFILISREIGIAPRKSSPMVPNGSSVKSKPQASEAEEELAFPQV